MWLHLVGIGEKIMNQVEELEFKQSVAAIVNKSNLEGFLLLYLDNGKVKFTGEVPLAAFAPLILKAVSKRFST